MTAALLIGRTPSALQSGQGQVVVDTLFQADRVDGEAFENVTYEHCTFANVSFKDARLVSCKFENCAFIDCYFRQTELDSSRFLGCKFITSDFPKAVFRQCTFTHTQFRGCFIPYADFESSLPSEGNLRRLLADNLAREAEAAGATRDARLYRLRAHEAAELYLRHGVAGSDEWSRDHFPSLAHRTRAGIELLRQWFNRALWGYGERGGVLLRNALIFGLLVFPFLFYLLRGDLSQSDGDVGFWSYVLLSADNLLTGTGFSGVTPTTTLTRAIVGIEVFIGLVLSGLSVTLLFRWITRR